MSEQRPTPEKQPTPDYGEPWQLTTDFAFDITIQGELAASFDKIEHANRAIACVNACRGMADPASEIQTMREAIKDAHYALAYVYNHGEGSCAFPFRTEDDLCSENRFHHVKDALDALKPFLP